jgi:hypothetical protein
MSYSDPQAVDITATYIATFQHVNGTQVQLMFIDPAGMGTTPTTNDDFQSAIDALSAAIGWTFQSGRKDYYTREMVTPS